jgi:hypothetical protein
LVLNSELVANTIGISFQHDRARVIYKYALDHLPKERCEDIYKQYTIHEKKYGDRSGIEDVIVNKRKYKYEEVSWLCFGDCLHHLLLFSGSEK